MEQRRLTKGLLLDKNGNLAEAGYATELVRTYNRKDVCVGRLFVKEWDYYYVGDDSFGIALTIADNGYMSLLSASLMDFGNAEYVTNSEIKFFSLGRIQLPASSKIGDVFYKSKRLEMRFYNDGNGRRLVCRFERWSKQKKVFECDLFLSDDKRDSMVVATPFPKPKRFYYNQKINCMTARGWFSVDGERRELSETALGTLDWGRGVWTYKNTWYWSSLSCFVDGKKFGFNLGYGFGDTSASTENMLFFDKRAVKLGQVEFGIPGEQDGRPEFLKKWQIRDDMGQLELTFQPILDRKDKMSVGIIATDQHQVFGRFFGICRDGIGGEVILDGQIGFAEKVFNKW